ncbi:hypothetical protein [Tolypothrix sp. PCC 7601]|uniref:hypothetical protein n=1 Tax=Tolypothrix sp. PCC 7601 TaxID=1188 RepID=UPI0021E08EE8|nr:hypothetical protein [Tolypothrix sp. PCC 7601]
MNCLKPIPSENGWQQFEVDCGGRIISVTVKPKIWKKLTDAQANYPPVGSRNRWQTRSTNRKWLCTGRAKHSGF